LTDEHKLVRDSARAWVKREVSPIIEEYAKAEFPKQILKGLATLVVLVLIFQRNMVALD
jgi:glutaryl-CoA dehydrogenase